MQAVNSVDGHSESASFSRIRELGVDLLHARFVRHEFGRHLHDDICIGAVEYGTGVF